MSKVVATMTMSLDGDVEFQTGGSDPMTFKVSRGSAEHLRGLW